MHLQGVDLSAPLPAPGGRGTPGVSVGKDNLEWPKIFAAAKTCGVKNYFVEMNMDAMKASVPYLRGLKT